jgi:hypothetical protein
LQRESESYHGFQTEVSLPSSIRQMASGIIIGAVYTSSDPDFDLSHVPEGLFSRFPLESPLSPSCTFDEATISTDLSSAMLKTWMRSAGLIEESRAETKISIPMTRCGKKILEVPTAWELSRGKKCQRS